MHGRLSLIESHPRMPCLTQTDSAGASPSRYPLILFSVFAVAEAIAADFAVESRAFNTQNVGRFALVPVRMLECIDDMLAFHVTSIVLTMVILGGAGSMVGAIVGAVIVVLFDKVIVSQLADLVALIWPKNVLVGATPDIRGANFFNFGLVLYLTVLLRARRKKTDQG